VMGVLIQKSVDTDVLVIGAGPAGSVAAAILNKKGYDVQIIEKQFFPRFVIGESLLPRCMENLDAAGFIETVEKAGFQKKTGAKFIDGDYSCEFDFSIQHTKGWKWTWQVKRDKFDKILADEVQRRGVDIYYGSSVTAVDFSDDNKRKVTVSDPDGEREISCKYVIDASGYGRVLPRLLNLDKPADFPSRASLFTHISPCNLLSESAQYQIQILNYKQGIWGWVIPFSDGTGSIGVVGDEQKVINGSQDLKAQMDYWVREIPALQIASENSSYSFTPKMVKGYSVASAQPYGRGFVIAGNSAEFIDPIFSSGTTFATESARLAAELVANELEGNPVNWDKDYHQYLQRGTEVFKTFIKNWYTGDLQQIIFAKNWDESIKNQICSILAGYVWDETNAVVRKHEKIISSLSYILK